MRIDFDLDQPGRHEGCLSVPHSSDESAWGVVRLPIACFHDGEGPTLLVTAGNHGDEYEGPVAVSKLWRALKDEPIAGRVILMPALNLPALMQGQRLSPLDGLNMNRVFPGDPKGSITRRIADYVARELIERADVVVDVHSGGKSLDFVPSTIIHRLEDGGRMEKTLAALHAFRAPVGLMLSELEPEGTLDTYAENAGKIFLSTELGGGARLTPETVAIADRGLRNLLAHLGLVEGEVEGEPTRLMEVPDMDHYVMADADGLYEPLVEIGDSLEADQALGRIHFVETPQRAPVEHRAPRSGLLYCRRPRGRTKRGDCLAVIARDAS